jgi:TolB-like protein
MTERRNPFAQLAIVLAFALPVGCGTTDTYFEPAMDFGSLQSVAVLPFQDLTRTQEAAERVRDTFIGMLLATEAVYVLPTGEVARGISKTGGLRGGQPSADQVRQLGTVLQVEAIITGVLREYGSVRSGTTSANVVSLSLQMMEASTGRVVWSASSTKGGITIWDRLLGTRGQPMNVVTEKVVNDLLNKLFE